MTSCKVFIPFGAVGFEISKEAFENGLKLHPDIISSDAGSTDSGPYYLGTGTSKYSRNAVKEDMRMILKGAKKLGIPVTIGNCGTCGTDSGVNLMEQICQEICQEENFHLKITKIYTQQDKKVLKEKFLSGKIHPLGNAPKIYETTFNSCSNIVALAGAEPFIKALKEKADVILCGRASDTSILAAMPLLKGCDPGIVWHGAKTAECGSFCTTNPTNGGVFVTFNKDNFIIEPTANDSQCTVYSVSAHMLYENTDPFILTEPNGKIDVSKAEYKQLDERRVQVFNSKFIKENQYTMKLEGSGPVGYQTLSIVGIRDPKILANLKTWLSDLRKVLENRLNQLAIPQDDYSFKLKPYGWNAVTEEDIYPKNFTPKEIGLILVVTGKTQEIATLVAKTCNPKLLHFRAALNEPLPSFAFPFSPAEIEKGRIYEFKLNHIVDVDDPFELVSIKYTNI